MTGELRHTKGFSLLELLVAATLLSVLVILVAQMANSAALTINWGGRHIDADSEARMVMECLSRDFAGMINRPDVDVLFYKNDGNDIMFFQSETAGYSGNTSNPGPVALIGYRINSNNTYSHGPVMERLGKALSWDGDASGVAVGGPLFLAYGSASGGTPLPASTIPGHWSGIVGSSTFENGSDSAYHVLSPAVFRMEYALITSSGSFVGVSATGASGGLKNISGIVIAIAVLDETSRKSAPDMTKVIAALADTGAINSPADLMMPRWKSQIELGDFSSASGLSKAVAANVRIYQRAFYFKPISKGN